MFEEPQAQKLGKAVDDLVTAKTWLLVAHIVLAIVSTFAMWKVTDSPVSLPAIFSRGALWAMTISSAPAWAPYLISWGWCRYILNDNPRAVLPFIVGATICACVAVPLMRNSWGFHIAPAPSIVGAFLTILLVTLAGVCEVIFPESKRDP
jgi:hypothetical protein